MKSCLTLKNRKKNIATIVFVHNCTLCFHTNISIFVCVCVCFFKPTEVSPSTEGRVFVSFMLVAGSSAVEHWL